MTHPIHLPPHRPPMPRRLPHRGFVPLYPQRKERAVCHPYPTPSPTI